MTATIRLAALLFGVLTATGCHLERVPFAHADAAEGVLVFDLNDTIEARIPAVITPDSLVLFNGQERMVLSPDSMGRWSVPVFDGTISLRDGQGEWHDAMRPNDYRVPLRWENRASSGPWIPPNDSTLWRLTFGEDDFWYGDLYVQQMGTSLRGSIATATGDFRYLHGTLAPDGHMTLSTFDGAHLFLFVASLGDDGQLHHGTFFSGNHYSTPFSGQLRQPGDPDLSEGNKAIWTGKNIQYRGIGLTGDSVHWTGAASRDEVHVLSIMGSWCPNCMDEHRLLLQLAKEHPELQLHTLAFERRADQPGGTEAALLRLQRFASQMGLDSLADRWQIILTGPASKSAAQSALPFLDRVVSFPTTVVVRGDATPWVHSGFNGPAMGALHEAEALAFRRAISGPQESH